MPVEVTLFLQPNKKLSSKGVNELVAGKILLKAACPGLPLTGMAFPADFPGEEPGLILSTISVTIHGVALGLFLWHPLWARSWALSESQIVRCQRRGGSIWGNPEKNSKNDERLETVTSEEMVKELGSSSLKKAENQFILVAALEWFLGKTIALSLG